MVKSEERRWLIFFALAVILITSLPYFTGYSRQGGDWRYTGFVFGAEDGNSYIAKMRSGMNGDWLFRTPYTPFAQSGALVYLPFLLLGKLAAEPAAHEQMVALYHLFRFAGIFLFVFATYDFFAVFLPGIRERRLGTTLAVFGGGLGWLSLLGLSGLWGANMPLEFYSPETFGFLMVYGLPHLACARAFLLWGMRDYLLRESSAGGWKGKLRVLLVWTGAGIMQPLSIVTVWAVIAAHLAGTGLWQIWRARRGGAADWANWWAYFRQAIWTGLFSAPLVLYTFLAFRLDPFLRQWEGQNLLTSPPFFHYLLAFAIILPLALPGTRALLKEQPWRGWLVVGWVLIFPLLAYAPLTIQRRLVEGVWVALVVIAVKWLEYARPAFARWSMRWLSFGYLSSLLLVIGGVFAAWNPGLPLFRPAAEVRAFQFLVEQRRRDLVVLAAHETSNALPAWTPVKTVIGHGPESLHSTVYRERLQRFFTSGTDEEARRSFLRETGATHVFWGPLESALGDWDPTQASYLSPIYQVGSYSIFRVRSEELP